MKKNKNNNGIDAEKVVKVVAVCAAVAAVLAPIPVSPIVKGVVAGTAVPAWLREHIFF